MTEPHSCNAEPETRNRNPQIGAEGAGAGGAVPDTGDCQERKLPGVPRTRNPKPETLNPQTPNPHHEVLYEKIAI